MPDIEGVIKLNLKESFALKGVKTSELSYALPFPITTKVTSIEIVGPSHEGPFRGAIDFCMEVGTPILCPRFGVVTAIEDSNDKYGNGPEFADYLNYVTIAHNVYERNGRTIKEVEYSQLAHFARGSAKVRVGQTVRQGDILGITGLSGWMTEPHLHVFVFKGILEAPGYVGLQIKFIKSSINLVKK